MEAVLGQEPIVVPVTVKAMVQVPLEAKVTPERLTDVDVAVNVPGGVQVLVVGVVFDTTIPAGSVSLALIPVRPPPVNPFGLLIKKLMVVVPFSGIFRVGCPPKSF